MWKPASFALALCLCTPAFAHHDADHKGTVSTTPSLLQTTAKVASGDHDMAQAKVGEIMVMNPMIRATAPTAPAAGGFVTLHNMGTTDDALIAANVSTDVAGKVELHTMTMDGDVMRMFEVEGGIALPAGEKVQLMPGGLHLMFMALPQGLSEGDVHDVTLVFENAGEVTLPFEVLSLSKVRELTGDAGHGSHGAHSGH